MSVKRTLFRIVCTRTRWEHQGRGCTTHTYVVQVQHSVHVHVWVSCCSSGYPAAESSKILRERRQGPSASLSSARLRHNSSASPLSGHQTNVYLAVWRIRVPYKSRGKFSTLSAARPCGSKIHKKDLLRERRQGPSVLLSSARLRQNSSASPLSGHQTNVYLAVWRIRVP